MIKDISQKETIELLNKCWMTHDGMWFLHCLQEFGIEKTNRINKAAIKSMSYIEIPRIKKVVGFNKPIENYDDFKIFFKKASKLMIPDFMNVTFGLDEKNQMTWSFNQGKYNFIDSLSRIIKKTESIFSLIPSDLLEFDHLEFNTELNLFKLEGS